MKRTLVLAVVAVLWATLPVGAQETPTSLTSTYDDLADAILALHGAEEGIVRSILLYHRDAARAAMEEGRYEDAAAHVALFASEGDNAIAGIRKRLLEGGHHHHAEEADGGEYEDGFVIVTREAKDQILAAAAALRRAGDEAARQDAWNRFETQAEKLLAS